MARSNLQRLSAALVVGAGLAFSLALSPALVRPVQASDDSRRPCPPEMSFSAGTCMDRYEARLLERGEDGSLSPFPPFERPTAKRAAFVAESRAGVRPQAYISQVEAASACQNAGKRLCTLSEWYRSCRGEQNTLYPYGAKFTRGRCNVGKAHLLSMLHGSDPNAWSYEKSFNDPKLDQRPGFLAETGAYPECVTSAGVFDLVGNLHEWVADRVDASIAQKMPLRAGIRARIGNNLGKGVFMGGFFSTTNEHGEGCEFVTMAHEPGYHDYSTGFRCCKDPEAR
ncbi:MAG TPA: SUMF1/EgtB/PvdO family nonheme iron enzyme [Polyangiaceae bacterium]|nr:SUMF1/EgtB/PvdO family nonheme iron enzyme [Polyangiaceae bacterium]